MRTGNEEGRMHRHYRKCPKCKHEIGPGGGDWEERTCPNCGSELVFNSYNLSAYKFGCGVFLILSFTFFIVAVIIGLQGFLSVMAFFLMFDILFFMGSYFVYCKYRSERLIQRWNLKEKVE